MSDDLIGAAAAAQRFVGGRALKYEARRSKRAFWAKEHAAVESMLSDLPKGSEVLDVPVGTGRYAPIYKQFGLNVIGVDASLDMLAVATEKAASIGLDMQLFDADALDLGYPRNSFDAVVCTRLVNWFLPDEMKRLLSDLIWFAPRVIVSIEIGARRFEEGNNPHEPAFYAETLKYAKAVEMKRVEIMSNYYMVQLARA